MLCGLRNPRREDSMTSKPIIAATRVLRAAAALAIAATGSAALAADPPSFTFDPGAVGLTGTSVTANNILISEYSKVTFTSATEFTETGYLVMTGFQSASDPKITVPGLGMYVSFTASGTTVGTDPAASPTVATFSQLSYTMYGYNDVGTATFGFDAGGNAVETAANEIVLATGSLLSGGGSTLPDALTGKFYAFAGASLGFVVDPTNAAFFAAPYPFYDVALTTFANTPDTITPFAEGGGFFITQGGGKISFQAPVPEPGTYALMFTGLAVVGYVTRRRRSPA
jgi:hypothetical protein